MITIFLKEYRKKNGLTQAELAKLMSVHKNTIRRWEAGDFEPRLNDLQKLCRILNTTVDELLKSPSKQKLEVKTFTGMVGFNDPEIENNSFTYSINNSKHVITFYGAIRIGTLDEQKNTLNEIIKNFNIACCLFDQKSEINVET